MADGTGFAVGDQFIRIQCHFEIEVVVDHHLEGLAFGAFPFIFVDGLAIDTAFRTETVSINTAARGQFFQEFRDQFLMVFFRDITKCILQCQLSLGRSQTESTVRSTADAFHEFLLRRQAIREFQFDGHCFCDISIFHDLNPLLFSIIHEDLLLVSYGSIVRTIHQKNVESYRFF